MSNATLPKSIRFATLSFQLDGVLHDADTVKAALRRLEFVIAPEFEYDDITRLDVTVRIKWPAEAVALRWMDQVIRREIEHAGARIIA